MSGFAANGMGGPSPLPTVGESGRERGDREWETVVGRTWEQLARRARRTVVAAVLGAGLVAGVSGVAGAATVSHRAVADVALDVAPLGRLAALRTCATSTFAADPDSVRVLYGQRQLRGADATSPVFVLRNGDGQVLLCDMFGRDRPATLPLPTTTAERPAVFLTAGQRRWSCDGTTLRSFRMTTWLKVQDPVRTARVRYTVDGVPGPWFTAARQGRFVHLQSRLGGALPTDVLTAELQLLDVAGDPVPVRGIPSGARPLEGCGTSVVIG